ncbi:MAG: HAD family hydrolase, partial [Candidatus Rokubacteria bacterium]|nr:HAD family hydrolase [Candidatus Rokubacteria bacterium]
PEPPLFRLALERLGLAPPATAMGGDSQASDIGGGRAVGMVTILYAPDGAGGRGADAVVRSFAELVARAGVAG